MYSTDFIIKQIEEAHKFKEEVCLAFADGDNEHLWVRKVDKGFFIDSENSFDSSEFPSETEPLLKEAGIEITYEPEEWFYGFHAIAAEQQFKNLISKYPAMICGIRKFTQEE